MAAGTYNFTIEQGATFNRVLTLQENGSAMSLSGYSAASQFRSTHDSSTVVGTISSTVSNASGGQITLSMTATATGNLEVTSSAGAVTRIMQGKVTVTPQVTR